MHATCIEGGELTFVAEKNLAVRGLPPLPITLGGVNTGKKIDRIYIQPGQVVEFVSYHCTLDVILSCRLLHIIELCETSRPAYSRCCCVFHWPGKNGDYSDT